MVTLGQPDTRIYSFQHRSTKSGHQNQSKSQKFKVSEGIALLTYLVELDCGDWLFGTRIRSGLELGDDATSGRISPTCE